MVGVGGSAAGLVVPVEIQARLSGVDASLETARAQAQTMLDGLQSKLDKLLDEGKSYQDAEVYDIIEQMVKVSDSIETAQERVDELEERRVLLDLEIENTREGMLDDSRDLQRLQDVVKAAENLVEKKNDEFKQLSMDTMMSILDHTRELAEKRAEYATFWLAQHTDVEELEKRRDAIIQSEFDIVNKWDEINAKAAEAKKEVAEVKNEVTETEKTIVWILRHTVRRLNSEIWQTMGILGQAIGFSKNAMYQIMSSLIQGTIGLVSTANMAASVLALIPGVGPFLAAMSLGNAVAGMVMTTTLQVSSMSVQANLDRVGNMLEGKEFT